jgi:integrase/recombinase XerD
MLMVPTFQQEHRSAHRQKIKMPCRDMRIGEVLKLDPMDIEDRKAIIRDPKSGRESEVMFLPQKVADRLRDYIREKEIKSDSTIFPLTYAATRLIVKKAGNLVNVHVLPHDLRRHGCHICISVW